MVGRKEVTVRGQKLTAEELQNRIAGRAYQLYETRGRLDGYDVQDWLEAEHELLTQLGYATQPPMAQWAGGV
jgi:hypothetical protein